MRLKVVKETCGSPFGGLPDLGERLRPRAGPKGSQLEALS